MVYYFTDRILKESSGEYYHTIGIIIALINKGVNVTVILDESNYSFFEDEVFKNGKIKFVYVNTSSNNLFRVIKLYTFAIRFLMRKSKTGDIIYTRDTIYTVLLSLLPLYIRRMLVTEINGVARFETNYRIYKYLYYIFDIIKIKYVWNLSLFNLCVSEGIKEFYNTCSNTVSNLYVIHNGLNSQVINARSSEDSVRKRSMVLVANFTNWQRVDRLCQILDSNRFSVFDMGITVDLYGSGPMKENWEEIVRNTKLGAVVSFKGKLEQSAMADTLTLYTFGLVLDDRYFNGQPLFSPLKYYEYSAFGLNTLYLSEFGHLDLPNCYPISEENFIEDVLVLNRSIPVKENGIRTWDDVIMDVEVILKEKLGKLPW